MIFSRNTSRWGRARQKITVLALKLIYKVITSLELLNTYIQPNMRSRYVGAHVWKCVSYPLYILIAASISHTPRCSITSFCWGRGGVRLLESLHRLHVHAKRWENGRYRTYTYFSLKYFQNKNKKYSLKSNAKLLYAVKVVSYFPILSYFLSN